MGGQLRAYGKVENVSDQENQSSPCQNIKKVKTDLLDMKADLLNKKIKNNASSDTHPKETGNPAGGYIRREICRNAQIRSRMHKSCG